MPVERVVVGQERAQNSVEIEMKRNNVGQRLVLSAEQRAEVIARSDVVSAKRRVVLIGRYGVPRPQSSTSMETSQNPKPKKKKK